MKRRGKRPPPGLCRSLTLPTKIIHPIAVFVVILLFVTVGGDVRSNEVTDTLGKVRLKSDEPLSDFVLTPRYIYVGGTNVLYQIDTTDFIVDSLIKTGPQPDSVKCHATGCSGSTVNVSKELTNNVNKALVVDNENQKLIVCGSIRQGSCSKYELRNISSGEVDFLPEAVAANDAFSSTFAFIGPQRYNRWGQGNVLYVGTTYTPHGDYRHDVPAISSRNLLDLKFAEYSFSKQSTLRIDVKYRDRFLVNYVYGFNSSSHVYFVTVQRKSHLPGHEEQGYITRISRACVTDANFDTYTEITLECGDNGRFNLVQDAFLVEESETLTHRIHTVHNDSFLVASFAKSQGSTAVPQNTSSAVCIFSLSQIDRQFDENIHNCFNGSTRHRNMEYISGTILEGKCPEKLGAAGNILNFCEVGLKISGVNPLVANPIYVTNHEAITSVHYSDIHGQTKTGVLLVGTSAGNVKSLVLSASSAASGSGGGQETSFSSSSLKDHHHIRVLATQTLSETDPVIKLVLTPQQDHVIALQKHTITKLQVSECEQIYNQCGECVLASDPFCGWCSLENRCTGRHSCRTREWITASTGGGQCSQIEQVIPSSLSLPTTTSHLTLLISALPKLPARRLSQPNAAAAGGFICVYGQNVTAVRAKTVARGLQCAIPSSEAFASYIEDTDGADSIQVDIRFADLGTNIVSTKIKLLDCAKATSCRTCTLHPDCHWCLESNACMAANAQQQTCYQSVRGRISGQSSGSCPRLRKSTTEVRVPNDVPIRLQLPFEHLHSFYNSASTFWCLVHIEEAKFKLSARMIWENATVICDQTLFNYNSPVEEMKAKVSVLVNDAGEVLDTKEITVFKCSVLGSYKGAQDCTLCSLKSQTHGCGWCPGSGCVSASQCPGSVAAVHSNSDRCPGPEIFLLRPISGPPEGGTVITIEGSNLGTSVHDLKGRIKIGGKDCRVLSLRNSVEATCVVPPLEDPSTPNATVILLPPSSNHRKRKISSMNRLHFHYLDYSVMDFDPNKGIASGGSLIRIRGLNLHIGSKVEAFFDDVPCLVNLRHRSPNTILCTTGAVGQERVAQNLSVRIDNGQRAVASPFFYTPDPIVHEIKPLTSFSAGGRILTIHGEFMDSVTTAQLLVYGKRTPPSSSSDHQLTSTAPVATDCTILSNRLLECVTPPLKEVSLEAVGQLKHGGRGHTGIHFPIGLRLDNVTAFLFMRRASLTYFRDPAYENFTNFLKIYNGDTLVIEGRDLNSASDQDDVRVTIGKEYCNITTLSLTQLLCLPPTHQPSPGDSTHDLPEVTVHVGSSLRYQIGYVRYNGENEELISSEIIGAISAITAVLVSIGIVVLIVLKHKSSQVEREYKRIQIQMDILENNVRSECKQAFAELQTDLTDLTMEIESSGIPILPHKTYVMNVFFPGVTEHPVLLKQIPDWQNHDNMFGFSMSQFEKLVLNKVFLLTLVDTIERQPTFGIRDRVNFASLLSIVLMTRMDYFSEILRLLLLRQIDRALRSRHPQLMLRRTETVVEKLLTNWLALCMHSQLEQRAGASLFLLYKAIKCQVEKGPVDTFTQEAKYSLSEEGLLRESMPNDYITVTCLVLQRELDEAYHAKVLDCDSITQVKAKILDAVYKNTAFTLRPTVHEVDLEWQCGQDAHVVLKDYDLTTKDEHGVKKINTMKHYGIKNKAVVSLVPSQFNSNAPTLNSSFRTNSNSATVNAGNNNVRAFHLRMPDHLVMNGNMTGTSANTLSNGLFNHTKPPISAAKSVIPEVYLTRLLATKGTVKKFIDDFFYTVFGNGGGPPMMTGRAASSSRSSAGSGSGSESPLSACSSDAMPPCAIKWLFDIFDEASMVNNEYIDDLANVVHAWKSNSVPLRFWITLIKNPHFVFDVEQTPTTELNLSIVAQALMSSCMPVTETQVPMSKEAPSHKLLFARDINDYQSMIRSWYDRIQSLQSTDQDLSCYMHNLSQRHAAINFNQVAALKEIFLYVSQYYQELSVAFGADEPHAHPVQVNEADHYQNGLMDQQQAGSNYGSTQHIYATPQSPSLQHQDFSLKLERIFKIVKESHNDHYIVR